MSKAQELYDHHVEAMARGGWDHSLDIGVEEFAEQAAMELVNLQLRLERVEAERDAALERASDAEDQERFVTAQRDRYAVQRDHALERLRRLENTGRIGHPAVELAEVACQRDEWRRRYEQLMAEIGEASK